MLTGRWSPSGTARTWQAGAADLDHRTVSAGHFTAEEDPAAVVTALRNLLAR